MIFLRELPKAIKLNALLALSGAFLFIVVYELALLVRAYGGLAVVTGIVLVGFIVQVWLTLMDANNWPPVGTGISSKDATAAALRDLFASAEASTSYLKDNSNSAQKILRAAGFWLIVTVLALTCFYWGEYRLPSILTSAIGIVLAYGAAWIVRYARDRRLEKRMTERRKELERLRERLPKDQ